MSSTQFFQKTNQNIDEYKKKIKKWLESAFQDNIIDQDVFYFLSNYFESQNSYIQRKDVDNFEQNIEKVLSDQDFKKYVIQEILTIQKNDMLSYSRNIISKIDDMVQEYDNINLEIKKQKEQEMMKKISQQKEQEEKDKQLALLESQFLDL